MIKLLLKKQLYEINQSFFLNRKTGTIRSKKAVIGVICGFSVLILFMAAMFALLAAVLIKAYAAMDLVWFYFTVTGTLAVMLGVFGSVFNTYSGLYKSKDNDLLLSLPITVNAIMCSRLLSVFAMSFFYSGIVTLPTVIVYYIYGAPSFSGVLFSLLLVFVIAFLVTDLSCALGYLVAKISVKVKNKTSISVIVFILFVVAYLYFCSKSSDLITDLIANGEAIASNIKIYAIPFYAMGKTGSGDYLCAFIFTASVAVITVAVYLIMKGSFYKIVSSSEKSKTNFKVKKIKIKSIKKALLHRELKKFFSSITYMLNSGVGILLMPILGVYSFVRRETLVGVFEQIPELYSVLPVLCFAIVAVTSVMCNISAPSISLEGKNLWIIRSLPARTKDVLFAKVKAHLLLTLPCVLFLSVLLCVSCGISVWLSIITVFACTCFTLLHAEAGVMLNLKFPVLNYTNETYAVKQGVSVFVSLFGGWVLGISLGVGGYFLCSVLPTVAVMSIIAAIMSASAILLYRLIGTKGVKMFENL